MDNLKKNYDFKREKINESLNVIGLPRGLETLLGLG